MIAAIIILAVILTLLPWRGAKHLDGPPASDDDPSDFTYDAQSPSPTPGAASTVPADSPKEG